MGAGGRSRLTFDETSAPPLQPQPQPRKAAQGNSDAGRRRYAWAGIFFLFAVAAPCARPSWELVSQLISLGGTGEQGHQPRSHRQCRVVVGQHEGGEHERRGGHEAQHRGTRMRAPLSPNVQMRAK